LSSRIGWSDMDEVWQLHPEYHSDYGDVVKVVTGKIISIWRVSQSETGSKISPQRPPSWRSSDPILVKCGMLTQNDMTITAMRSKLKLKNMTDWKRKIAHWSCRYASLGCYSNKSWLQLSSVLQSTGFYPAVQVPWAPQSAPRNSRTKIMLMMPCYSLTALISGRKYCQASMKLHIRWVWIPPGRKPRFRTYAMR